MSLVSLLITSLAESDDQGTDGKNIVANATCALYDSESGGNAIIMYDDASGTNGATAKNTDTTGQVNVYVTAGNYFLSVNGGARRAVKTDNLGAFYGTYAEIAAQRPVTVGQVAFATDRDNAKYTLQASGYTALFGDITAANGRVWKLTYSGRLNVDWLGLPTGGDDAPTILSAIGRDTNLKFNRGKQYRFETPASITNSNLDIDFNDATIIHSGDFTLLKVEQSFTDTQDIISFEKSAQIDLTNGDSGSLTTTTSVDVADSSGYAKGDIVKVVSDDTIGGIPAANLENKGEFAIVAQVDYDDDEIFFFSHLRENYTTNPRIAKMSSDYQVNIKNATFNTDGTDTPSNSGSVINLVGCHNPKIKDIKALRTWSEFVELDSCLRPESYNIVAYNLATSFANYAYGYVLVEYSCEAGVHYGLTGYDCRHVYTTGTRSTQTNDVRISRYGSTRSFLVVEGYGKNCQNAAFDTHYDARGGMFKSCVAEQPHNGPNGTQLNYQLRGVGTVIADCESIGGRGIRINGAYDELGAGRLNVVQGGMHRFLSTANQNLPAIHVTGASSTNKVLGAKIIDFVTDQLGGSSPHYLIENAEVEIINPQARMKYTADGFGEIVRIESSSTVHLEGGQLDYEGSTGLYLRLVRILDGDSKMTMDNTRIKSSVSHIVDLSSLGSEFHCRNLDFLDQAPANAAGYTDVNASPNVSIDYVVDGGRVSSRAVFDVSYSAAGDKDLDLEYRGAKELICTVTVSQIATRITTITDGVIIGQQLTIINSDASSEDLLIYNTDPSITSSADKTIAPGDGQKLVWTGATWHCL